jgi:glycosyltransferase involved in cell wall biosynthesis
VGLLLTTTESYYLLSTLIKKPFFSIIIPVFNRDKPLANALESVLSQSVQDFEVIIIDDGSKEDIAKQIEKLVSSFEDNRLKLLKHSKNINGAAARNTGINASVGRFVCFLDSDDCWLPNKLQFVQERIHSSNANEFFLIHHQYCNSKSGVLSEPIPSNAKLVQESVAHYSFVTNNIGGIQSSTICMPLQFAKICLFNEGFSGHQDWDLTLQVGALTDDFRFINETLTIRGKDSQDSVAESLDWQYSLWFYSQMSNYFENKSASYYFQRVVLKKAKFSIQLAPVFFNTLFLRVLLSKPYYTFKHSVLFLAKNLKYQSRVKKVLKTCKLKNVKTVMIWGANNYAKSLILKLNKHVHLAKIIDAKATSENDQLLGVNIVPIRAITRNELDNIDAIILATDNHHFSMKNELLSIAPSLLAKVITF